MRTHDVLRTIETLFSTRRGPLYRAGQKLTSDDRRTVIDAYQMWLCIMIDLGYLNLDRNAPMAGRLVSDLMDRDIMVVLNGFSDLYSLCQVGKSTGFKALCQNISSHLYPLLKDDVKRMASGNPYAARKLIQVSAWTSRITLRDIDLTDECLQDYRNNEQGVNTEPSSSLVRSMQIHINRWMKHFDPVQMRFGHGPGGVAGHGRTTLETKYKDLTRDRKIDIVFGDDYVDSTNSIKTELARISQTIFVPKSFKTFRTISMEPATLMYLQQGVWKEIDRCVAGNNYLRNRIGFHDQERNNLLAKEGSIYRNYATIDLSAASDMVSWALVKRLFKDTPLYPYLLATRSDRTLLPDGELLKLKKFAPMGSALCFPIETIIFASVCEVVLRRRARADRDERITGDYSVFGDDIIVPTVCASDTMSALQLLGFRVNTSKSFYDAECWYRESCGKEYCDGIDVTPIRISRKYYSTYHQLVLHVPTQPNETSKDEEPSGITGVVDLANRAYGKGLLTLRGWLIQRFLRENKHKPYVPYFGEVGFHSTTDTNFHSVSGWDADYQRSFVMATRFVPTADKANKGDNSIALRHWLETRSQNNSYPGDCFESNVGSSPLLKPALVPVMTPYSPVTVDLGLESLRREFRIICVYPQQHYNYCGGPEWNLIPYA